jgi:glycosyltransferase involved in cell wall biosynthesis
MPSPSLAFVACNRVGSRLRTFWPAEALAARGWEASCSTRMPKPGTADVVVIHRPLDIEDVAAVLAHKASGAVVLVDEDDDLTCIPFRHHWHPDPVVLDRHDRAIRLADGLTTSTQRLAAVYGPLAKRTWILPNYLPRRLFDVRGDAPDDGKVRIGWAGIITTHAHDLEWLAPEANRMVAGAVFTTIGDHRTQATLRLRGRIDRVLGFSFEEAEFYEGMARADIGIVPLEPCDFNLAKSWLKALEYMALGKPVVATDLPEQRRLIRHGVTGFLASTPAEFADHVQVLVHDAALRRTMGEAARAQAESMALEDHIDAWEAVLGELLEGRNIGGPEFSGALAGGSTGAA